MLYKLPPSVTINYVQSDLNYLFNSVEKPLGLTRTCKIVIYVVINVFIMPTLWKLLPRDKFVR